MQGRFAAVEVPAVVMVQDNQLVQRVVGTATVATYESVLFPKTASQQAPRAATAETKPARPVKSVIVFTTQSCSWCVKVKNYLRQNRVSFKEVDVGRDPKAARDLVRRTGQQGVPQLDIGGTYVVGFDKTKIDRLLGLSGAARASN